MKILKNSTLILCLLLVIYSCKKTEVKEEKNNQTTESQVMTQNIQNCPYIDDSDCDSITDEMDNCPNTYNPGQEDTDGDGIGDVCDSNNDPITPPTDTTSFVNAETYLNNYCHLNNLLTYECGLARGITEVLNETKPLFANATVYEPFLVFYKIDSIAGTSKTEVSQLTCETDSTGCYSTFRSRTNDYLMRQSQVNYLYSKLEYIENLKLQYPNLSEYYNGYREGCVQAYWFSSNGLPSFKIP